MITGCNPTPFEDTCSHDVPCCPHVVHAHPGHQQPPGILWGRGVKAAEVRAASRGSRNGERDGSGSASDCWGHLGMWMHFLMQSPPKESAADDSWKSKGACARQVFLRA